MKNRKGRIKIAWNIIHAPQDNREVLSLLFSRFYPVFISHDFNSLVYEGYCQDFDEVDEGCTIPEYTVTVTHIEETDSMLLTFSK